VAKRNLAELKIPASSAFIPVAKRVATTLGSQLGLSLMDLDELTIALTQACDSAIAAAGEIDASGGNDQLKLTYFATNRALVVDVDLLPAEHAHAHAHPRTPADAEASAELQRLAYEMIRCFVDDFRPEVEPRTGQVRFRMVKYLAG
jgi:hypothetical protein